MFDCPQTYQESKEEFMILEQMENQRQETLKALKTIISPDFVESFAMILASAYESRCDVAEKIVKILGLEQLNLCAVDGDFERYKKELYEERYNAWQNGDL